MAEELVLYEGARSAYDSLSPAEKRALARYAGKAAAGSLALARQGIRYASGANAKAQRRRARRRNNKFERAMVKYVPPAPQLGLPPAGGKRVTAPVSKRRDGTMMVSNAITRPVRMTYKGLADYRVRHSEYIADVNGSVAFSVTGYRVNAGDGTLFPWLSRIAPNFEQYKFNSLSFHLRTQSASTTTGSLMSALDYDPTDPLPANKADLLQYEGAIRSAPWSELKMIVDPSKMHSKLLVAPITSSNTADVRLQDAGTLIVATQGQADTSLISELWVEYDVTFSTPQAGPKCFSTVLTADTSGSVTACSSGSVTIVGSYSAYSTGGNYYGLSFVALSDTYYNIIFHCPTSSAASNLPNLSQNGSSVSVTSRWKEASISGLSYFALPVARNDSITVGLNSADAALVNGDMIVSIQIVDPSCYA
jgi:hypothetical protein